MQQQLSTLLVVKDDGKRNISQRLLPLVSDDDMLNHLFNMHSVPSRRKAMDT